MSERVRLYYAAEVIVRYPKFDGSGYLALPVLRGADRQFVIDIEFRPDDVDSVESNVTTATADGGGVQLMMFSSDRDDAQFDFFSVTRLRNGQIEFRFVWKRLLLHDPTTSIRPSFSGVVRSKNTGWTTRRASKGSQTSNLIDSLPSLPFPFGRICFVLLHGHEKWRESTVEVVPGI